MHQSFYLWAIILIGFVASACVNHWPASAHAWGWIYIFALLYTIVTLLFDVKPHSRQRFFGATGCHGFILMVPSARTCS